MAIGSMGRIPAVPGRAPAILEVAAPRPNRRARLAERLLILALAAAFLAGSLVFDLGPSRVQAARDLLGRAWPLLAWPALAMSAVVLVSTAWRLLLWAAYRPLPAPSEDELPAVTVVVPAFNEGAGVEDCLRSLLACDYPADRLRVVAVDDGSTDDTLAHLRAGAAHDPARCEVLSFGANRGKRHAVHAAMARAVTPVVVTVDSDTVVEPGAIRALVAPLVRDPSVGAVAGRIEALNRDQNLITRMLGVRYRIGFDFVRAAQSQLGSVLVCPGALTAYRREVLAPWLDAWRDQRFLGARCNAGDDHALTNRVLSLGLRTAYQGTAVARTMVPWTYGRLSRMYLRWARSNVRETARYLAFAPRLLRDPRRWPAVIDAVAGAVQIPLRLWLLFCGYGFLLLHPGLLARSIAAALVFSLLHVAVYLRSERSLDAAYAVLYGVFSLLTLQWVYPWATVTVRESRWLTR